MSLQGKVVLVTGGSRGLGRVMALGLARAGASVAITARPASEAKLAEVLADASREGLGERVAAFACDVAELDACEETVAKTRERFGGLHVLINNAAAGMDALGPHVSRVVPFWDVPPEVWHRIIDTNVNGPWYMARAAVRTLLAQKWGRIVNLSTGLATMTKVGFSPYGPSKAAVESMTAIWAKDLADSGVTVNALLPGRPADTDMVLKEDFGERDKLVPAAAMVPPALWLASERSDGVTGMRVLARDWNAALPPEEAFKGASAKAAW